MGGGGGQRDFIVGSRDIKVSGQEDLITEETLEQKRTNLIVFHIMVYNFRIFGKLGGRLDPSCYPATLSSYSIYMSNMEAIHLFLAIIQNKIYIFFILGGGGGGP